MTEDPSLYCKIFVDAPIERDALTLLVASGLDVQAGRYTIALPFAEIDVRENEEHRAAPTKAADDFIFFRYYLDVVAMLGQQRSQQIQLIARIIETLWAQGFSAVAACGFEEELPERGGYGRPRDQ